jgi:hypothetical protein
MRSRLRSSNEASLYNLVYPGGMIVMVLAESSKVMNDISFMQHLANNIFLRSCVEMMLVVLRSPFVY